MTLDMEYVEAYEIGDNYLSLRDEPQKHSNALKIRPNSPMLFTFWAFYPLGDFDKSVETLKRTAYNPPS